LELFTIIGTFHDFWNFSVFLELFIILGTFRNHLDLSWNVLNFPDLFWNFSGYFISFWNYFEYFWNFFTQFLELFSSRFRGLQHRRSSRFRGVEHRLAVPWRTTPTLEIDQVRESFSVTIATMPVDASVLPV
jgi:hypothetical protein